MATRRNALISALSAFIAASWAAVACCASPFAAAHATEDEIKTFYQLLADWEKQHHDALQRLYASVREDFFAAGSFAPF